MKHKTITLKQSDIRHRVRLHSIDGRIWCAESPRRAAYAQITFNARRRREYSELRRLVIDNVIDELEGIAL